MKKIVCSIYQEKYVLCTLGKNSLINGHGEKKNCFGLGVKKSLLRKKNHSPLNILNGPPVRISFRPKIKYNFFVDYSLELVVCC